MTLGKQIKSISIRYFSGKLKSFQNGNKNW